MAQEVVIFDIDGTLADISQRVHFVQSKPKNWDAFNAGMTTDKSIYAMVRLCNLLYEAGLHIVLCSGRNEEHRPETIEWLNKEGVQYHELLLRRNNDRRQDAIVKREMLRHLDKSKILFVVEDRSQVVDMWRAEGLTCLQCAPGEF